MKKIFSKPNKGFTLIETLVALAIFSASVTALISVTGTGVANVNYAKNKFVASYLAQEGVEMVRNIRDNAWLLGGPTGWSTFITTDIAACAPPNGCTIEPKNLAVAQCINANGCPLYYDSAGFYTHASSSAPSFFSRKITVDNSGDPDEIKITSTVSWRQGSLPFSASYSENLLNWNQ